MKFIFALIVAVVFLSNAAAFSQSVILWKNESPPAGFTTREELTLNLDEGKFKLGIGDKGVVGTARAFVHDIVTRTQLGVGEQEAEVGESVRNIVFSFGKKGEPKDTAGHLAGKKITGGKIDGHWKFGLVGKKKTEAAEATALRQFAGYTEFVEALGLIYGEEARKVGDVWKPDLSAVKKVYVGLDVDLLCKLEDVSEKDGDRIARISVKGHLGGEVAAGSNVRVEISGTISRSLRDMIDTDLEMSGTFNYTGAFGKSSALGAQAEISAPLKVRRTVVKK